MSNVIGGSIGGIERLSIVLHGFDLSAVAERYPRSEEGCKRLFDDIRQQLAPKGKPDYNPRSLWRRFCGTATSGAAFLAPFPDAKAFKFTAIMLVSPLPMSVSNWKRMDV
ncbi:MAG TPA: hypothetical protein VLQ48_01240 [Chloroflexia bacterium]|nr:hypothetical protein [Chloroflexia bacterium]